MKCLFFPVSHAKYSQNIWILHVNKPKKTLEGGEKTGRFPRTQGTTQSVVSPLGIRTSALSKKKAVHTNCSSPATGRLQPRGPYPPMGIPGFGIDWAEHTHPLPWWCQRPAREMGLCSPLSSSDSGHALETTWKPGLPFPLPTVVIGILPSPAGKPGEDSRLPPCTTRDVSGSHVGQW